MLKLHNVATNYGKIAALHSVTIEVPRGKIVTIIGANGAGKTTTLKTISGLLRPANGTITFDDADISKLRAEQIVQRGIIHVPEGRKLFPGLTVTDNLMLGATSRAEHSRAWRVEAAADLSAVYEIFPRLRDLAKRLCWSLSGGEQQMCAIGRGLMARPTVLMLDEPSLGLAPVLVQEVFKTIVAINQRGTTILLVEQNARQALSIADYAYVLETGHVALAGDAHDIMHDEQVKRAYLGSIIQLNDETLEREINNVASQ